jgi:hypothetical protein
MTQIIDAETIKHPFAKLMRLVWIDLRVEQGNINRSDIAAAFSVSVQQASYDLKIYQSEHPDRIEYDHRAKTYRRRHRSKPVYPDHLRLQVQLAVHALKTHQEAHA